MICRVVNETSFDVNEEMLKKCVRETVRAFGKNEDISCSIVIAGLDKIRELNEKYYNKKGATDVLTFSSEEEDYAGDVVVCPSYIKESTGEEGFEWEFCHVVVHGTIHLLGIHHEEDEKNGHTKQHEKEVEIINKVLKNNN
ncbi:MAG: rRNA maturation RNase YbeY [Candidatus Spechtbacterales bacterium]